MFDPFGVVVQPAEHLWAVCPENVFYRLGLAYQNMCDDERNPERVGPSMPLQVREL